MMHMSLTNRLNNTILFKGKFNSIADCLEAAVTDNVTLTGLDISFINLTNANLDNATFINCNFRNTNLCGANLSECRIIESDFTNALLCNTCICETELIKNDFTMTLFGATDIAGSTLENCKFSTNSSLDLNFSEARHIQNCIFECPEKTQAVFNHAPIVIKGLFKKNIAIFDGNIKIGTSLYAIPQNLNLYTEIIRTKSV